VFISILFLIVDKIKIWPIILIENNFGTLSVMADDIAAGLATYIIVYLIKIVRKRFEIWM